jgi:succinate-acetate transporter protein
MTQPAPATDGTDPRWKLSPTKIVVGVLLLVGIVVPLLVGTYARVEPRLFGFPFFYWYQLFWVFLAAGLCFLSFVLLKREKDAYARTQDAGGSDRTEGGPR